MVILTPRFTLLAVSCTLATISLSPLSASAVAIQARDSGSSSKGAVTSRDPILQRAPVHQIPSRAAKRSAAGEKHEERSYHNQVHFGDRSTSEKRDYHLPCSPHHQRRSSLIVAGQHGESYVVSQTSRAPIVHKRFDESTGDQAYFESEADQDEVPGRVDVMSPTANTQQSKKLGSLWMDPGTFTFKSSEDNVTEISLVTVPEAPASNSSMRVVLMKLMMFSASSTDLQSYCATTHTQGGSPDMTAEKCDPQTITPLRNQLWMYNVDSGVITPTQMAGQDDGKKDDPSSNSTEPTSASIFGKRDVGGPSNAQNVELMFVSKAPEVANVEDTPKSPQVTVVTATTTMTSTFTYTTSVTASVSAADVVPTSAVTSSDSAVTSSLVSTSSVPVSAADASPTSATVSSSSSVVAASTSALSTAAIGSTSSADASSSSTVTTTDTLAAADASSTSLVVSSSSATSSASSVPSLDALNVQVVAPVSSSVTSTTVTSTSTSATPTSSINADALASSIAASFASSRATAASSIVTSATTVATAAAMDANSGVTSSSFSSSMPSMTPVSTDPYTFMFKTGKE